MRDLPPADSPAHRRQQELLVGVHQHLRGELRQIQDAAGQVRAGSADAGAVRASINGMAMRQNYWTLGAFCAAYCRVLTVHHTIEDLSWFPAFAAVDDDLRAVTEKLHAEHEVIAGLLVALDDALVALVTPVTPATPVGDGLDAVEAVVRELSRVLLQHLDDEEAALLPALGHLLVEG